MGSTGNSTGNHLHFAVYKNNQYVDSLPFLINNNPFELVASEENFKKFVRGIQAAFNVSFDGVPNAATLLNTKTISTNINWNHQAVKVLQEYLITLGYDLGKYGVDGKYGADMKKVIMDYQKNVVGLKGNYVDGVITARMYTWQSLLQLK